MTATTKSIQETQVGVGEVKIVQEATAGKIDNPMINQEDTDEEKETTITSLLEVAMAEAVVMMIVTEMGDSGSQIIVATTISTTEIKVDKPETMVVDHRLVSTRMSQLEGEEETKEVPTLDLVIGAMSRIAIHQLVIMKVMLLEGTTTGDSMIKMKEAELMMNKEWKIEP
jgi:hypothetical protein